MIRQARSTADRRGKRFASDGELIPGNAGSTPAPDHSSKQGQKPEQNDTRGAGVQHDHHNPRPLNNLPENSGAGKPCVNAPSGRSPQDASLSRTANLRR